MKDDIDQKDEQDKEYSHAHDENTETVGPRFKGGRGGLAKKGVGTLNEFCILPGVAYQHRGRAAHNRSHQEHSISGSENFSSYG